jgi:hypothetical protein
MRWLRSPREYCTYLSLDGDTQMYSSCTSVEGVWFLTVVEGNGFDMYISCDRHLECKAFLLFGYFVTH